MNKIIIALFFTGCISMAAAQDCNNLSVDITKGTLNGLSLKSSQEEVKKALPCFTATKPDGSMADCGGGVYFANHNFFFYTGADNINIRKGFTGKCSVELIGMTEKKVTEALGKADEEIKDEEGVRYLFFKRTYGCLVVKIDKQGNTDEFFMFGQLIHEVNLCV